MHIYREGEGEMKRLALLLAALLIGSAAVAVDSYQEAPDDPTATRVYTLDNGIRVYLSKNTREPRAQVLIAFNSGSTVEPEDTTGLAHYLEHLLFKGSKRLAALDWEQEKPLLDRISTLYEQYRATADAEQRREIYTQIDRLATEAATYSTAGEYGLLADDVGAVGTNAFTSWDQTVYINDVPVNQLDKLLTLEAERFAAPVFRRFHTELETVYEEFNRMQDNDARVAQLELFKNLYAVHPYGRPIIGKPEHLKNPSIVNLEKFYAEHYVPANLSIIIAGDIDYDATLAQVKKHFGGFPAVALPPEKNWNEPELTAPVESTLTGPGPQQFLMAFRFAPTRENRTLVTMVDGLLCYKQAGSLEALGRAGLVQTAASFVVFNRDSFLQILMAMPRPGQTLDEAKALLIQSIDAVKAGDFPDWQLEAIANNLYYDRLVALENRTDAAMWLLDVVNHKQTVADALADYEALRRVTKEQVVAFAQANYNGNYAAVFKRTGEAQNRVHVDKPVITPVPLNEGALSAWGTQFMAAPADTEPEPVFLDFARDLPHRQLQPGLEFYYRNNDHNERFSLSLVWNAGDYQLPELPVALGYWQKLGAGTFSADELKREWFRLGVTLAVSADHERTIVSLSGLADNFPAALTLLQQSLTQPTNDPEAYKQLVDQTLQARLDARKAPDQIFQALWNYGLYGADNPSRWMLSEAQLRALEPSRLLAQVAALPGMAHEIFYFGPASMDAAQKQIAAALPVPEKLEAFPAGRNYIVPPFETDRVYLVNFPMAQVKLVLARREATFDPALVAFHDLYNTYVYQAAYKDLREARALAYVAAAYMAKARKVDQYSVAVTQLETQADKLPEALQAMTAFSAKSPELGTEFVAARGNVMTMMRSGRVNDEEIFTRFLDYRQRGVDHDLRRDVYAALPAIGMAEFTNYFNSHIAGQPGHLLVIGDVSKIDRSALEKFGPVEELTIEQLMSPSSQ